MKLTHTFHAANLEEWRAWLSQNHASRAEIWLIFDKKETGQPCISYEDSIEEALCFGWVDSLIQKIDDATYARKYTPRRADSAWSETNKRRVRKMVKAGRMTPAGLAKITFPLDEAQDVPQPPRETDLPADLLDQVRANSAAWANFNRMAPSQRRHYTGWVMSARRAETRQKRLEEVISVLAENKPLGMK